MKPPNPQPTIVSVVDIFRKSTLQFENVGLVHEK